MKIHEEEIASDFIGTIIDLETIGRFNNYPDSRRYKDITPVIFGFIDNEKLRILCAKTKESIPLLKEHTKKILPDLKRPFHAFQSEFERAVLFHFLGHPITFESELNKEKFEKKELAVRQMNIPKYEDPFKGEGLLCMNAWLNGDIEKAIAHNKSCLLKERDILRLRGNREPDPLKLQI